MARQLIYDPSQGGTPPQTGGGGITNDQINSLRTQIGTQVLQQGGKLSDITTALDLLQPLPTDDKAQADEIFSRRLGVLEYLWFSAENELTGEGGNKINRYKQQFEKSFGASSAVLKYETFKKTLGATLAKEAGDTGNIAYQEQLNQLNALPVAGFNTKGEAESQFKQVRTGYGNIQDRNYYQSMREGNPPAILAGLTLDISGEQPPQEMLPQTTPQGIGTTNMAELSPLQRLFGTAEQAYKPNLPLAGAGGEIGSAVGSLLPLPPGLRVLLGGGIGQTYENIGTQGFPLTREAAKPYGSPLGMLAGPLGAFATQPMTRSTLGAVAPYAALDVLLNPHKVIGGLRGAQAQHLTSQGVTVPGKEIVKSASGTATRKATSQTVRGLPKYLENLKSVYKGDMTIPQLLEKRPPLGNLARLRSSGAVKGTKTGMLSEYERSAVTNAIKQRSSLIAALDAVDTLLYGVGSKLGAAGKIATTGAIGAVPAIALGSYLRRRQ